MLEFCKRFSSLVNKATNYYKYSRSFCKSPDYKSYKILLNKFEYPSTHSTQDLMEILDISLQNKLKFSFVLLIILFFYNIFLAFL